MAVTRINNNQITDSSAGNVYVGINAGTKLQDYSITAGKIANSLTYGSDLTITGNLTVNGQTTTIDTVSTVIEDPVIVLASNQTGTPAVDIGFIGERGDSDNIAFVWDESADEFVTAFTTDLVTNTTITISSYANFHTNDANIGGNLAVGGNISITGNVTSLNVTGNISGGNLLTPGVVTATGNVTGGNIITAGQVVATGNITGGNVTTAGITSTGSLTASTTITATGNVSGGNVTTAGQVAATGNVTGGNLITAGLVSAGTTITATGNITGGNLTTAGITNTGSLTASTTITATGNITGGNLSAGSGIISTTGNINGANVNATSGITAGTTITATGNVTGGNLITTGDTRTGTLETTGNALIGGNLIVQGNITYINIDDLRVEDPIIILGTGPNGAPLTSDDGLDRGVYMEYFITGTGTANAFMGYDNSTGNMFIASNVNFTANDVVGVNSYGTLEAGNLYIQSAVSTGNITGGNVTTAGITSTGSLTASTTIDATGNITGGNLSAGSGIISTTGNINGANVNASAGITAGTTITATGNITGGNVTTVGITSTGSLTASTTITATGNITGGNINTVGQVVATGNVNGGNVVAVALVTGANVTASANVTGANVVGTTSGTFGNIVISGDDITDTNGRVNFNTAGADVDFAVNGDTVANVFYVDAGTGTASFGTSTQTTNALVAFNSSTSILMPVGNTQQRPGTGVTGMMRFNSTTNSVEVYDNSAWTAVGVPVFTVIDDQQFNGDGSTVAFTINSDQTTNSCIVSINGVVQIPTIAYSVSGTTLTFTEAPESGDIIDVRQLTTTTTVVSISNSSGNAIVQVDDTTNNVSITGDLVPTANVTYDLGSNTARWRDGYFSGSSLILGNVVMKNVAGGNSIGFFGPDGTTPATIAASSVDTTQIASGTSSVSVIATNGNIRANVGGTTVQTISAGLVSITGDLSVTGNATLTGNILGDRIQNGTTTIDIQTPSGNANITVGATSNVAVFSTAGANITGTLGVSGNITGGNLSGTSIVGTLTTAAQTNITSVGTLGALAVTGNTTSGNFVGTLNGSGANVTSINATNISSGTLAQARLANASVTLGSTALTLGATVTTIAGLSSVTSTTFVGALTGAATTAGTVTTAAQPNITSVGTLSNVTVTANVAGGNITTAGQVVATGNITGGNLITAGLVSLSSITKTGSNGVGNIGSSTSTFNTIFAKATSAQYADLAEKYVADAEYPAGTVVVFGGEKEVTVSLTDADRAVAGVVSTNPSYIMNAGLEAEHVATVALTGRVPTRVTGTVRKGDLMVSAGYGLARAEQDPKVGTVIGKALENHEGTEGVIEVVVGRF
jgi:filamentous hemagglutinin